MQLKPITRMWERVEVEREDSDIALFNALMFCGELTAKVAVATMVAAIEDDRDRSRYAQLHGLVRADGLGDWGKGPRRGGGGPHLPAAPPRRAQGAEGRSEER